MVLFNLSMFMTSICSVEMPIISSGVTFSGPRFPETWRSVTIPVAPVVPMPVDNSKNAVLNPMVCLPSSLLRESVDNPETVTTSPTANPCGSVANPTTLALKLSYSNTMFSTFATVEAIDTISLPLTCDTFAEYPLPESFETTLNRSFTL